MKIRLSGNCDDYFWIWHLHFYFGSLQKSLEHFMPVQPPKPENIENDKQCYSMSSKSANYVAMNPSQFNIPAMTNSMENDDDLQCNKVLPLIPFDPTHNASTCGSSRACHDYESLDPIR